MKTLRLIIGIVLFIIGIILAIHLQHDYRTWLITGEGFWMYLGNALVTIIILGLGYGIVKYDN